MRDYLKAQLSDSEAEYVAGLGEDQNLSDEAFCREVFANLDDPLLSLEDLQELRGEGADATSLAAALDSLQKAGILERSEKTQRPFDVTGTRLYRRAEYGRPARLTLLALESKGAQGHNRYQFSVEGRLIRGFARIDRLDALSGEGQQRQEIKKHVERIREGVASGTQVPNPVLLVLVDSTTQRFEPDETPPDDMPDSFVVIQALEDFQDFTSGNSRIAQQSRLVEITLPWRYAAFDEEKSVLLVDGQQRTAALSLIGLDEEEFIDVGVAAVIASEEDAKRVFQVANETVKISTDFSNALLASMEEAPGYLRNEQKAAETVRLLALADDSSPFYQLVKYPNSKNSNAVIAYNSVFGLVNTFRKNLPEELTEDPADLASMIADAFRRVKSVWPDAWARKPAESKLMHGAGLRAITQVVVEKLQNFLINGADLSDAESWADLEASLKRLSSVIAWTDAEAAGGTTTQKKNWREEISGRQNTNQDTAALTAFLSRTSVALDMKAAKGSVKKRTTA